MGKSLGSAQPNLLLRHVAVGFFQEGKDQFPHFCLWCSASKDKLLWVCTGSDFYVFPIGSCSPYIASSAVSGGFGQRVLIANAGHEDPDILRRVSLGPSFLEGPGNGWG